MSDVELDEPVDEFYKAPEKKTVAEIISADSGDDALERYKASLLGNVAAAAQTVIDPTDPRVVLPMTLEIVYGGTVKDSIDLTRNPEGASMKLKEGVQYHLRLGFNVQREIVTGLRYLHRVAKMGITIEKESYMLGSYGPRAEVHHYNTPQDTAPEGMMQRGKYKIKSKLIDDDGHEYLSWSWNLEIAKDW
ncbi:hypothetical protein PENTCL1PPCAC_18980 [Pristionchus entomophagus]|uniref:Rho GDP-dissociation inhibitor n=1 Tax=Pristionchus entomophagus TaxID=358040 RepID=A0AAV5TQR6_9BILA|nr:hypothetical protein PENTCL1PPCAC_18980 [Pristionchus entomophagus]